MFSHKTLSLLIMSSIMLGVPRFALENGASCQLCHINPTGGGLRNDYGNTLFALDELPMRTSESLSEDPWDGVINRYLQFGGDGRFQTHMTKSSASGNQYYVPLFPMQADIYAHFTPSENVSFFTRTNLSGTMPNEFWLLMNFDALDSWLKIGRSIPDYGIRLDDHSAYIRGGNIRNTYGMQGMGLFFTPDKLPSLIEFGFKPWNGVRITSSIANRFISGGEQFYGFSDRFTDKTYTHKISFIKSYFEIIHTNLVLSYLTESVVRSVGVSGGISTGRATWTFEVDKTDYWTGDSLQSLTLYHEFSYNIRQGLTAVGRYEYFDPDHHLRNGSVQRITAGIELFPRYGLQYIIQARFVYLENIEFTKPDPEFLIQVHYWF